MERFGERLRSLRIARGLSCSDLAQRVGVTEGAVRQMESGQTKIASFVVGLRIARELDADAWYLATGTTPEQAGAGAQSPLALRVAALEERLALLDRLRYDGDGDAQRRRSAVEP